MPEFLYIHIPFCVKKCIYCDFLSFPLDESLAKKYVDALCKELEFKRSQSGKLRALYIGGGTPSVLPEGSLRKLSECIRNNFSFYSDAEITIEANPGTINRPKIDTLLSLGINRMSIGVQSFIDNELKTLGRIHSAAEASESILAIKNAGLKNLSVDLMYGIPGQTMETWKESLSKALSFSPSHISSYELTPEKGTPLFGMLEANKIHMPDEDLVLEMYDHVIDHLSDNNYEHYEISNFAKHGFRCIHNLNYWDRGEYIGAGAGAHSFINGIRTENTGDITEYTTKLSEGMLPVSNSLIVSEKEAQKELIFLGLRKTEGIRILKADELGLDISDACRELVDEGYLEANKDYLRLTRKGIVISNEIIVKIFEKLKLD